MCTSSAQSTETQPWAAVPPTSKHPKCQAQGAQNLASPTALAGSLAFPARAAVLVCSPCTPQDLRYLRCGLGAFWLGRPAPVLPGSAPDRLRPGVIHFEFGALAVGRTHLKDLLIAKLSVSFRGYDLNFVALDEPDYYHEVWHAVDACHLLSEHLWQRAQERGCPAEISHTC
jgi:hypothetical protein